MAGKTTRQLWIELEDFVERVVNNASAHEIDHEWYGQRYDNLSDFAKGELETLLPQVHKLGPPATYPSDLSNAAEVDSFRRAASSRIRFLDDQIWDLEAIIGMEDELPGSDVPRYLKIELHRRKILLEDLRKHFDNLDDAVKTHKDEIRRRRGDLGPGWWHGPTFGRGGYGDASLCIKRNWYGNIIDRVVMKESKYSNPNNDPYIWNPEKTVPNEITAMCSLRPLRGSSTIVQIRNWRIDRQRASPRVRRIFMEWWYGISFLDDTYKYTFETLVRSFLLLERGEIEEGGGDAPDEWKLIVHRDLKPGNVFLSHNCTDIFQGFHTPKLGDFGLCLILDDENLESRKPYIAPYRFFSPEERADVLEGARNNPQRITKKTNVWEIGMFMHAMLTGKPDGDARLQVAEDRYRECFRRRRMPVPFHHNERTQYSAELRSIVMACVEYLPEDRPFLDEALDMIRTSLQNPTRPQRALTLRHAPADDPWFSRYGLMVDPERYKLGTTIWIDSQAPPPRGEDSDNDSLDEPPGEEFVHEGSPAYPSGRPRSRVGPTPSPLTPAADPMDVDVVSAAGGAPLESSPAHRGRGVVNAVLMEVLRGVRRLEGEDPSGIVALGFEGRMSILI